MGIILKKTGIGISLLMLMLSLSLISDVQLVKPNGSVYIAGAKDIGRDGRGEHPYVTNTNTPALTLADDFSTDSGMWGFVKSVVNVMSQVKYPGSAYRDSGSEYMVLTENRTSQAGIIWLNQNIFASFTVEFRYRSGGGTGADGLVFMFYKREDYDPYDGGGLGFVAPPGGPNSPTAVRGYGIEFDSWYNQAFNDPSQNHIALIKDSVNNHLEYTNDSRTGDNQWHNAKIAVASSSVEVYLDGEKLFTWEGLIDRTYGGLGFSATTATYNDWHLIDDVKITYGTVYIRSDGSIEPPGAPISTFDNVTYTLTGNITSDADGIGVGRDNIVVDGSGFTIEGTGEYPLQGVYLDGRSNVTIKNTNIKNFTNGIWLYTSTNNNVSDNTITDTGCGISLDSSSKNNSIRGNTITDNSGCGIGLSSDYNSISENNITNSYDGISLSYSSNNSISGNIITKNDHQGIGFWFSFNNSVSGNTFIDDGLYVSYSYSNTVENNTVNGKPLVYLEEVADYRVEDAGQVVLIRCNRIRVENLNLSRTSIGAELRETNNSIISGNTITANSYNGIRLDYSSNSSISGNTIANNSQEGILLIFSSKYNTINENNITNNGVGIGLSSNLNSISSNTIADNGLCGILFLSPSNNSISGNTLTNNGARGGIWCYSDSYYNSLTGNTITNNSVGIYLQRGSVFGNIISGNTVTNNGAGIVVFSSKNSSISGNTVMNNGEGIWFVGYLNNSISGNTLANNRDGIWLEDSSNSSISGNTLTNNGEGILLDYSSNNTVCHNNFVNNTVQVNNTAPDYQNFWDNGYPSGGNYWSNYNGTDANHDNIGDTPYVIDANNTDNYPLMKLCARPVGDINEDGRVDMKDISYVARRFMSVPNDPLWDPVADINGDNKIDMKDISMCARHFGEHYP